MTTELSGNVHQEEPKGSAPREAATLRASISDATPLQELQALISGTSSSGVIGCSCGLDHSLDQLAVEFDFPEALRESLLMAGTRPKLEIHGKSYLLRITRASFVSNEVVIAPVQVVCHGQWMVVFEDPHEAATAWHPTSTAPEGAGIAGDTSGVLSGLIDASVQSHRHAIDMIEDAMIDSEAHVFNREGEGVESVYRLGQQVTTLKASLTTLARFIRQIPPPDAMNDHDWGAINVGHSNEVADILTHVVDIHAQLTQLVAVNTALIARRQNDDMKRISAWAAILFAPTLVGAIYGMNFAVMPELEWTFGYPLAIGAMFAIGVILFVIFRRQRWL